ncbi:SMI1/KNR4 family protein [Dactylosporangium sp. AC04546]|uniref:SMI1/KNR4 family protein n=1 Tax=Dactylosporangium sp. AC04546 TaxID=2862460 RepID=UPI001EDEBBEF|nr:SMI1/KNR4 family protein [Dactylosporangium sp. AC04546]WVK87034.1 SMI1/KNR4 family protein [Dactylosporangium sp. AC04546]
MDFAEFDALAEPLQRRWAQEEAQHGFALIGRHVCTPEVIALVEGRMGVIFPDKYKVFMTRYGGGVFGFVELLPLVEPDKPARRGDIWSENERWFPERDFVAVAEVGTGDYWGFPVTDGRCHDQVWFHFHDQDDHKPVAVDFLEFIAEQALKSPADRALERRDR